MLVCHHSVNPGFHWSSIPSEEEKGEAEIFGKPLDILEMTLTHGEGDFPRAEVLLHEKDAVKVSAKAQVTYDHHGERKVLFSGNLAHAPLKKGYGRIVVLLTIEDKEALDQLEKEKPRLMEAPHFDPLFCEKALDHGTLPSIEDLLEGTTQRPHWDRQGAFCFSDILKGGKRLTLDEAIPLEKMKVRLRKNRVGHVHVTVSAQWIQEYVGAVDFSAALMERLPEKAIGTLTPQVMYQNWWAAGIVMPQTGYTILQSCLRKANPWAERAEKRYSPFSAPFKVEKRPKVHVPCGWFIPHLVMGVHYRQKRKESVTFALTSGLPEKSGATATKSLDLNLQDVRADHETPKWQPGVNYRKDCVVQHKDCSHICIEDHTSGENFEEHGALWEVSMTDKSPLGDMRCPSYFLGDRGQSSIMHAVLRARALLAEGSRTVETSFEVETRYVLDVDCDTTLCLRHPDLPGGSLEGKVARYEMLFKEGRQVTKITLLSTVGNRKADKIFSYGGIWEDLYRLTGDVVMDEPILEDLAPKEGLLGPEFLEPKSLLCNFRVYSDYQTQNEFLEGKSFASLEDAQDLIHRHPTRLRIDFKSLSEGECVSHTIPLESLAPWNPPAQVCLNDFTINKKGEFTCSTP